MTDVTPEHTDSQLEIDLAALYSACVPERFAQRLNKQLQERAEDLRSSRQGPAAWRHRFALSRRPALAFALLIVLILAGVLAAIGPQRVLAVVRQLLGYVPGLGFVDFEEARQLAGPVTVIRGGVTFQLEQVVAQSDKTLMTFSLQGLPDASPQGGNMAFEPQLRLPNGGFFLLSALEYGNGGSDRRGKLEFPPIPAEFDQATLEFEYLPEATPGAAPEGWQVPFALLPAGGAPSPESFVLSSFPAAARTSVYGVSIQVLQVAQTESEMAVQLRTTWDNSDWQYEPSWTPLLKDDLGHIYQERSSSSEDSTEAAADPDGEPGETFSGFAMLPPPSAITTPSPAPHLDQTYVYPGISAMARRWTLSMPEMEFYGPAQAAFQIDLGENPVLNQTLPVDQWVQVAGMDVHILAMRLAEETFPFEGEAVESEYVLEFVMEPSRQEHGRMYMLEIESNADWIIGGGAEGGSHNERLRASLSFDRLPKGTIEVRFSQAVVTIEGPWEVSWEPPEMGQERSTARLVYPGVGETRNGVTLAIEEAMLSDRLTRLQLSLTGAPAGAELVSTFPRRGEDEVYLMDETGRRLDPLQEIGFAEPGFDPAELRFASLPAQSQTLLLNIPEVEVFYPGQATLAIEAPRGVQFHEETEQIAENITRSRWVSDPWLLDLPLEIAGHHLRFDQARLERRKGDMEGMYDYRLELSVGLPAAGAEQVQVSSLRVARIARPDEISQTFDSESYRRGSRNLPYSTVRPSGPGSAQARLILAIDVTAPEGIDLTTGRYTIELDGVVVSVPGPWQLRWSIDQ